MKKKMKKINKNQKVRWGKKRSKRERGKKMDEIIAKLKKRKKMRNMATKGTLVRPLACFMCAHWLVLRQVSWG